MICSYCGKDLAERNFYPSTLKRKRHICKKCQNKETEPSRRKYLQSLKELPEIDFNRYFGGFSISILNYTKKNEFKYIIKPTRGEIITTNDKDLFLEKIKNILTRE